MTEKRPDTIGAFFALITSEGRVLYQMRLEKTSITGSSYAGDYELPGGRVKENDLKKVLTPQGLLEEASRETEEELGIIVSKDTPVDWLYRTIFENPESGKVDWAFAIPVPSSCWAEKAEMKRKTVTLNPDELAVLGERNLIVSGRKRMWRMGQAGLFCLSRDHWQEKAYHLLNEAKPDWYETEVLSDPARALMEMRKRLDPED